MAAKTFFIRKKCLQCNPGIPEIVVSDGIRSLITAVSVSKVFQMRFFVCKIKSAPAEPLNLSPLKIISSANAFPIALEI
jgi:hypothetical protein